MHHMNVALPVLINVSLLLEQVWLYYHNILFSVFLGMLMSHSRTNDFTYRLFFFAGKGWRREKKGISSFCYFPSRRETPALQCRRGHAVSQKLSGNRTSALAASF